MHIHRFLKTSNKIVQIPHYLGQPAVNSLGKPAAEPKVPGSNPWYGMDVEQSVLAPTSGCAQKLVDGRFILRSRLST